MGQINSQRSLGIAALWFVCGLAGCGQAGPEFVQVTGNVTFETEPLPKGDIIFIPTSPELTASGGPIVDGKYTVKAVVGEYRVKISASREVPGKTVKGPDGNDLPVLENYIPQRYNDKTELFAEVLSGTNSGVDFQTEK